MLRHALALTALVAAAVTDSAASAQTLTRPGFAQSRQPTFEDSVVAMLGSSDPREQAWGAFYAGGSAQPHFVPFFTTKPTGSGIGLALSRQIAEAHGGSLALENRTDARGCRAVLRLPL